MKKILIITQNLSRTGAPIVLMNMIRIYHRHGYRMEMITRIDGELRAEVEEMQIPVKVQEYFLNKDTVDAFLAYAVGFDLVVANTLVTFEAIHLLKYLKVPVMWWLHEGSPYLDYFAKVMPDFKNLPANIHVFSVGPYVQNVIEELFGAHTEILHFGIEDFPAGKESKACDGKIHFLTAAGYSEIKGQDVLVEAIRQLPQEYLVRAEFYFCGSEPMTDEEVFLLVKKLSEEYENVTLLHWLPRKEVLEWMERCDCLIVPSRIESMSAVAIEMMMKGNLCLCTDVCGVAHYIEDGVNGFTVPSEDANALAEKIAYIIDHNGELDAVRKAGRSLYEKYFSMEVFENRIMELAEFIMDGNSRK